MSARSLRKSMDAFYESGRRAALAGIPPTRGVAPVEIGGHYDMAYVAGYQALLREAAMMRKRVATPKVSERFDAPQAMLNTAMFWHG